MLKKLFYASASLLMFAFAYHLGATTAHGQVAVSNPAVATFAGAFDVVTANGDVYVSSNGAEGPWSRHSNIFAGGPSPVQHPTWGQLKARYRK